MRLFAQTGKKLALQFDDLHEGFTALLQIIMRQWVAATRFRESAHEGVNGGVQKNRLNRNALTAHAVQLLWHLVQRGRTAHVHCNGYTVAVMFVLKSNEGREQLRGQVVYAVVARVL